MTTCPAFSSLLNISDSKITNPDVGFSKINFLLGKKPFLRFRPKKFAPIADSYPSSSGSCNSATISNSVTLDFGSVNDEEVKIAESKLGSKVRVTVPVTVYHVPKLPELELTDKVGVLKQYVGFHKGKRISANLPYKVEFETDQVLGRDGKPAKFTAHLRDDEFEILE